jgi:hypothetical protein
MNLCGAGANHQTRARRVLNRTSNRLFYRQTRI